MKNSTAVNLFLIGILFLSSVSGYRFYQNVTTSTTIPDSGLDATVTISPSGAGNFDGDIGIVVFAKIKHSLVADVRLRLQLPNGKYITLLTGNVNTACAGSDIDATFSEYAGVPYHNPLERCDTTQSPMIYGKIRPHDSYKLSPSSGAIAGDYKLVANDRGTDGIVGTIEYFGLLIADDIDEDGVDNNIDICPLVYNPTVGATNYQPDENMNGIGNECECDYRNYHVPDNHRKICVYLDNWSYDGKHYKGQKKRRGDWAVAVMPLQTFGTFQPGDYSHKNTWLDCDCKDWPILP